jgi:hypothetical protein
MDRAIIAYLQNHQRWISSYKNGRKLCTSYMGANDCKPWMTYAHTASSWWGATRGRLRIFLRNLLGEHKPQFNCDTIRGPITDMYMNNPEELAWTISLHFQDWFSKPKHHEGDTGTLP